MIMTTVTPIVRRGIAFGAVLLCSASLIAQSPAPQFKVVAYEHKTNKELSSTFQSETQNLLIVDSLLWLGGGKKQ
jgi:hypothetical protein